MNITFISDTHNLHEKLNPHLVGGDILIHCGDVTTHGTREEAFTFLRWFDKLPYKRKMFLPGNHDNCFDPKKSESHITLADIKYFFPNTEYFYGILLFAGNVSFYGHPYTPIFQNMAFNANEKELSYHDSLIPLNTDILVTHGPPREVLDFTSNGEHVGSQSLLEKVQRVKPKVHAFGHIHERYGIRNSNWGTKFINASNHTWLWKGSPLQPPVTIEI